MPKIIMLNQDRDTVKRLVLDDDGATLQAFTRTGRVEISLTAEELELVRTSCLLPDCNCPGRDARELDDLAAYWGLPRGTLGAGEGHTYAQGSADEGFDALKAVLQEYEMPLDLDLDLDLTETPMEPLSPEEERGANEERRDGRQ